MTKKQNENNLENNQNTDTNKNKVDVNDYIFLKPHRKKKKVYAHSSTYSSVQDDTDYIAVSSTRSSGHSRRKKKMKTWKKVLLSIVCTLLGLILVVTGSIALLIYKGGQEMVKTDYAISSPEGGESKNNGQYVIYNGETYEFNENITNILVIGTDKRNSNDINENGTGGQADVLILAAVDTSTGETTLINISRDTMTEVDSYSAGGSYIGTEVEQICLSYAYGDGNESSCENTVNSVKRLFYNIPINTYLSFNLDGIAVINDSVGGIDVTSPETINDFTEGETYHLMGNSAESFVRSRNHETADANSLRMKRQQIYLTSFINKVIEQTKKDFSTPLNLFNLSSDYTCTNLNASKVCYLAEIAVTGGGLSIDMTTVPGEVKMGETYAEFYVNEDAFYELFLDVFYTKTS